MVAPIPLGPGTEFDLIRRFLERSAPPGPDVLVGPGDDCAVISGGRIAVSTDLSVEGVHFRRDWVEAEEVGYRAAAAALSDLAAVAALPIGILVSLALPEADVPAAGVDVMDGARRAAEAAGAALLGGDVARSPGPLAIDVTVLGRVKEPILRSGAQPGDELWVTGELGAAAAAVRSWQSGVEPAPAARAAFVRPRPRIQEAHWLARRGLLHALIDLSDGLAGDAAHLAAASRVGILIDAVRVPVHPAARQLAQGYEDALRLALAGGEDYELCIAAPPGAVEQVRAEFERAFGVRLSRVGEVLEEGGLLLRRADGSVEPLALAGFRHFHGESR